MENDRQDFIHNFAPSMTSTIKAFLGENKTTHWNICYWFALIVENVTFFNDWLKVYKLVKQPSNLV